MAIDTPDTDPVETREWLESVDAVVETDGRDGHHWRESRRGGGKIGKNAPPSI